MLVVDGVYLLAVFAVHSGQVRSFFFSSSDGMFVLIGFVAGVVVSYVT
jgi:hypothetical protein